MLKFAVRVLALVLVAGAGRVSARQVVDVRSERVNFFPNDEFNPTLSGGRFATESIQGTQRDIAYVDSQTGLFILPFGGDDQDLDQKTPRLDRDALVYESDGQIYYHDLAEFDGTRRRISGPSDRNTQPDVSGQTVVWVVTGSGLGGGSEVFMGGPLGLDSVVGLTEGIDVDPSIDGCPSDQQSAFGCRVAWVERSLVFLGQDTLVTALTGGSPLGDVYPFDDNSILFPFENDVANEVPRQLVRSPSVSVGVGPNGEKSEKIAFLAGDGFNSVGAIECSQVWVVDLTTRDVAKVARDCASRKRVVLDDPYLYYDELVPGTDGAPDSYDIFFVDLAEPSGAAPQPLLADPQADEFLSDAEQLQLAFENFDGEERYAGRAIVTLNTLPSVQIAPPSSGLFVGDKVNVTASVSDPDGQPIIYQWSLSIPQGSSTALASASTDMSALFFPDFPGVYTLTLEVSDGVSTAIDQVEIEVAPPPPPAASIGLNDARAKTGELIQFDGGDPGSSSFSYFWDFGDNGTSSDPQPLYAYTSAGRYTVTLTVTDAFGQQAQATAEILVNTPPVVSAVDQAAEVGSLARVEATVTDEDGQDLRYTWELVGVPDGSTSILLTAPDEEVATFLPDTIGTYRLTLSVSDGLESTTVDIAVDASVTDSAFTMNVKSATVLRGWVSGRTRSKGSIRLSLNYSDVQPQEDDQISVSVNGQVLLAQPLSSFRHPWRGYRRRPRWRFFLNSTSWARLSLDSGSLWLYHRGDTADLPLESTVHLRIGDKVDERTIVFRECSRQGALNVKLCYSSSPQ